MSTWCCLRPSLFIISHLHLCLHLITLKQKWWLQNNPVAHNLALCCLHGGKLVAFLLHPTRKHPVNYIFNSSKHIYKLLFSPPTFAAAFCSVALPLFISTSAFAWSVFYPLASFGMYTIDVLGPGGHIVTLSCTDAQAGTHRSWQRQGCSGFLGPGAWGVPDVVRERSVCLD